MLFLGEDKIARVSVAFDGSGASSGTDTSDATLTSGSQMLLDVSSYSKGKKYVGTIPTVEAPTPSIEVSSTGLITSTVVNPYGYQSSEIINADTKQLPTQEATTIIPSFSEQIAVESGVYTTGKIIVSAVPTETKIITANGTYTPTNGKYFSSVQVAISGDTPNYQSKTISPSTTLQTIIADEGYDALSSVVVNAIKTETKSIAPTTFVQKVVPTSGSYLSEVTVEAISIESKSITANGTYVPTSGKYFSEVIVNVPSESTPLVLQEKTVTPNESTQTVSADDGYDGLSTVVVNPISSTYVGSAVPTKGITTIAPSTSSQTVVSAGTYVTGDITVSAMLVGALKTPTIDTSTGIVTAGVTTSGYIDTSKTATLQLNTKSAETFTPTTSDQTITFGQYLTGTQTIKGDANLIPGNIISGKSIFGVSGNVVIQKYYTGTTEPSSSLGNDGDIYLKA